MPCPDAGKALAEALADEEAGVAEGNKKSWPSKPKPRLRSTDRDEV